MYIFFTLDGFDVLHQGNGTAKSHYLDFAKFTGLSCSPHRSVASLRSLRRLRYRVFRGSLTSSLLRGRGGRARTCLVVCAFPRHWRVFCYVDVPSRSRKTTAHQPLAPKKARNQRLRSMAALDVNREGLGQAFLPQVNSRDPNSWGKKARGLDEIGASLEADLGPKKKKQKRKSARSDPTTPPESQSKSERARKQA